MRWIWPAGSWDLAPVWITIQDEVDLAGDGQTPLGWPVAGQAARIGAFHFEHSVSQPFRKAPAAPTGRPRGHSR